MNFLSMLQAVQDSSQILVDTLKSNSNTLQMFISFGMLVTAWSFVRPSMIRDYDNRALPHNTTARLAFVVVVLFTFTSLALGYLLFIGTAAKVISTMLPAGDKVFEHFKGQPALLACITLGGLLQFSMFRDIERSILVWLHSRRHVSDDLIHLASHLAEAQFNPSAAEKQSNLDAMRRFGIYVTDESLDSVGLVTFAKWRKTFTLLRLVRSWNEAKDSRVLGDEDMRLLEDLETSHYRKTELAMTILKVVDEVQQHQSGETEKALGAMLKVLSETPHVDRSGVAEAEARAKIIISSSMENLTKKQLRLTSAQLKERIGQIERYFDVEYRLMLEQISLLAARSVALSGDKANDRLEQLKNAGISGLGTVQQFSVDRILWIFLVVALGGFLLLYLGWNKQMAPGMAEGLARFSFAMAIAALIGAAVGSRRRHTRAKATPWLRYFVGGLLAAAVFVLVSVMWNAVKVALHIPPPEGQPPFSLLRTLIWSVLPAFTAIAIARLARLPYWPVPSALAKGEWMIVRVIDGAVVSAAFYLGWALAFPLHDLVGLDLAPALKVARENASLGLPVFWSLQALGFLIGFVVVRDVRQAAHATIIESSGRGETAPSAPPLPANVVDVAAGRTRRAA